MEKDLRASLIAGSAAAVLSIAVGVIARVDAFTIFLRAFLGGLLFGGLVFGAFALARRFLPELISPGDASRGTPAVGANVDITLAGDEGDVLAESPEDGAGPSGRAPEEGRAPRQRARAAAPEGDGVDDYAFAGESLLDDAPGESEGPGEPRGGPGGRGDEESDVEELEPAQERGSEAGIGVSGASRNGGSAPAAPARHHGNGDGGSHRASQPRAPIGLDELDVLPDLDSLSDGFARAAPDGGNPEIREYDAGEPRARDTGGSGKADPAMLAQAVRTLLKRDQER